MDKHHHGRVILAAAALALASPALAQQAPTPSEQALGAKLMAEINAGLSCSADVIKIKADLAAAQARVKELETQAEIVKQQQHAGPKP